MHIYFPDPWPKRKHRRRRLIQQPFLQGVRRVLRIGGWLGIVTDHQEYFQQIAQTLASVDGLTQVEFFLGLFLISLMGNQNVHAGYIRVLEEEINRLLGPLEGTSKASHRPLVPTRVAWTMLRKYRP